jgi:hypothetical protein
MTGWNRSAWQSLTPACAVPGDQGLNSCEVRCTDFTQYTHSCPLGGHDALVLGALSLARVLTRHVIRRKHTGSILLPASRQHSSCAAPSLKNQPLPAPLMLGPLDSKHLLALAPDASGLDELLGSELSLLVVVRHLATGALSKPGLLAPGAGSERRRLLAAGLQLFGGGRQELWPCRRVALLYEHAATLQHPQARQIATPSAHVSVYQPQQV